MKAVFLECDSGCAHINGQPKEDIERDVADVLAGRRGPLLLPPGRHVVVIDVPDPQAEKADTPAPVPAEKAPPPKARKKGE